MTPVQVTLEPTTRGDTWDGIPTIVVTVNGLTPALPVASARMQFRQDADAAVMAAELTTAAGSIVIVSPTLWMFSVPATTLGLGAGDWAWDFETTDTNQTVKTYFGGTMTVVPDVTR